MNYTHLTREERYQIVARKEAGHSLRRIAEGLGRSASTISRELCRNRTRGGYCAKLADQRAEDRARFSRSHRRITPAQWNEVKRLLKLGFSPEQISERSRIEGDRVVSAEWIYEFVYATRDAPNSLVPYLRCQKPTRKRWRSGRERRGRHSGTISIHERPQSVDRRSCVGHWEADTMEGGDGFVVTVVERKTRYTRLGKVAKRRAANTRECLKRRLADLKDVVRSVTVDNGKEFADHREIADDLAATVYFADPHSPWQRGTNENTNGLIRYYLPKGTDLKKLPSARLKAIENRLNHRPRKCLGYRTPYEVMYGVRYELTVALRS